MQLINKIGHNTIFFDRGRFDNWCVYLKNNKSTSVPKDVDYFKFFQKLSKKYGKDMVYNDFLKIYNKVSSQIDNNILSLIFNISRGYSNDDLIEVEINFNIIYASMVAERNKKYAVLKEKIKRLGFHQVVVENIDPTIAANYSKGKKAKDLLDICSEKFS